MEKVKKLMVVYEDKDHPFKEGETVTAKEQLDLGVVWAVNEKGEWGCLIPDDYQVLKES